ncbi:hypothetical protein LZL87_014175 [Fusarium oxysporum]|nr:hypothetical protein LZL87_014175 [Fusarium oxysporum]
MRSDKFRPQEANIGVHKHSEPPGFFSIGCKKFPPFLIRTFALQKAAAARANQRLGSLDNRLTSTIVKPAEENTGKRVTESGWGQRHHLDGVGFAKLVFGWTIPKEYILLYAPRNKHEIRVAMEIVKASIGFAADSTDIKS